ncbi:hypothetical protein [Streptomyces sp. NPDC006285]|uniref:hypothetical protein n=1 Tax=Streptomyces sp. NPDC006285 TaxID=3364742 RepID=UPI00368A5083
MSDVSRRRLTLFGAGLLMTASVLLRMLHVVAVVLTDSSRKRGSGSSSSNGNDG